METLQDQTLAGSNLDPQKCCQCSFQVTFGCGVGHTVRCLNSGHIPEVSLFCFCLFHQLTGSSEERQVHQKALSKLKPNASFGPTSARDLAGEEGAPSISGRFRVVSALAVGKEVSLALMLKNLTRDRKTVTVNMTAWTIVYNGTLVHEVWRDSATISLDPEEGNSSCSCWDSISLRS